MLREVPNDVFNQHVLYFLIGVKLIYNEKLIYSKFVLMLSGGCIWGTVP